MKKDLLKKQPIKGKKILVTDPVPLPKVIAIYLQSQAKQWYLAQCPECKPRNIKKSKHWRSFKSTCKLSWNVQEHQKCQCYLGDSLQGPLSLKQTSSSYVFWIVLFPCTIVWFWTSFEAKTFWFNSMRAKVRLENIFIKALVGQWVRLTIIDY